jgi:hypothetical protein
VDDRLDLFGLGTVDALDLAAMDVVSVLGDRAARAIFADADRQGRILAVIALHHCAQPRGIGDPARRVPAIIEVIGHRICRPRGTIAPVVLLAGQHFTAGRDRRRPRRVLALGDGVERVHQRARVRRRQTL